MKKKMIKGAVSVVLVVAMAACAVGCGKKNVKNVVDPALAKEGVYKYKDIDLGFDNADTRIVGSIGKSGSASVVILSSSYDDYGNYSSNLSVCNIDSNGNVTGNYDLEKPDCSGYVTIQENSYDYGYTDDFEMGVGDANDIYPDVVVTTTGVAVADLDEDDVDGDYYYEDDIFYGDDYYEPEPYMYENYSFRDIKLGDDGRAVGMLEYYCSGYDEEGNTLYCDVNLVCGWDSNGAIEWTVNANELTGYEWVYSNGSALLNNGDYFVILSGNQNEAYIFDKSGNVANKKAVGDVKELESVGALSKTKDGRLLLVYYDMDDDYSTKAAYLDPATITVKERLELPEYLKTNGFSEINNGYSTDFVVSTTTGVAKFNAGDKDITLFMNYINSDIDTSGIFNIVMIDDEHFIGSYYDSNWDTKVAVFTYVDPKDIPDKQLINMAVYYLDYNTRARVIDFNKENDEYRIIVTNYSEFATEDDYLAGYTKLNNDIIAGNCPDIVIAHPQFINYSAYANKGLLVDIDDLIAKDDELKDNNYLENVFDAYAVNGKHYIGVYSFEYLTFLSSTNVVGNATSWTISDFKNMQKNFPAGSQLMSYITRDSFLNYMIIYDGSEFVNVETGKCEFDSEDFVTLLEYAATLPEEVNYEDDMYYYDSYGSYADNYRSGKYILMDQYLYEPKWYQSNIYEYFNGEATAIGFPSRTGDSAVISTSGLPFAIFSNGNVDGAWSFAREVFTEEYQNSIEYDIPVLESAFDKWAAKGMERNYYENEDGTIEYYDNYYYIDDVEYVIPVMTQADVDAMKNMITSCSKSQYYNQDIYDIIEEEASACFSGQKTAKEVAGIIQSRVQLYINENN